MYTRHLTCFAAILLMVSAVFQRVSVAENWAETVSLPTDEKAIPLFNGRDFSGWEGKTSEYFSIAEGTIRAANDARVPVSTYLFTTDNYRNFRLLLEVKQTRSPRHSTMHTSVAALGQRFTDRDEPYGFRGPLLMCCGDWGVWDANRRNRVFPPKHEGGWDWNGERVGEWNRVEILVIDNRIRMAANEQLVMDFVDDAAMLESSPIGLQLHANEQPQEIYFRGLFLVKDPADTLVTVSTSSELAR